MSATDTIDVALDLQAGCHACVDRAAQQLERHPGVTRVLPGDDAGRLAVSYDPSICSPACLTEAAAGVGEDLRSRFRHEELRVTGMDCADCARNIERAVARMDGVSQAETSFATARLRVEYEPTILDLNRVGDRIRGLGYGVLGADETPPTTPWWRRRDALTLAALVLLGAAVVADIAGAGAAVVTTLYAMAIAVGGAPVAKAGVNAARATRRPDINLLMTVAVIGAAAIGAWLEGALVVVLFSIGELLEGRAVERARRELAGLVSLAPDTARVRRRRADGVVDEVEVPVGEIAVGEMTVVRPGERIAVDGVVREGDSAVDQAPITGESTPVDRGPDDPVFAGTLNGQGLLIIETSAAPGDSTLDKIARLVVEAQARRSPSERWVDRFAAVYTPIVIAAAVLVAVVSPLLGASWGDGFYNALALLILACPCALVISTPVSIVSSMARASAAGVLVKGGAHLEQAAALRIVAFDKTGTLTQGRPRLVSTQALSGTEDELLSLAASLEHGSEHPLARAIVAAAVERGLPLTPVDEFQALTGLGARGRVDGHEAVAGSARLFDGIARRQAAVATALEQVRGAGATPVIVTRNGRTVGVLGLADEPRPEAAEAIRALHRLGIDRTIMLTGDGEAPARAVGEHLGIDEVRAELMPGDKASLLAELGPGVAMVGDGVNDAPALAAAELGIAMGSAGSDTAIEVADVALMGDDPRKVAALIGSARWTKTVVRQNVVFSLVTKLAAVVILAFGALPLWGAVVSDVGASLLVVLNGLRLLRARPMGRRRSLPLLPAAPPRMIASTTAEIVDEPDNDACCAPPAHEKPVAGRCSASDAADTTDAGCCRSETCTDRHQQSGDILRVIRP